MKSQNVKINSNTVKITVSAIMVALAVVLSFIKVFDMPYGGSITLFSMVPIMFVGFSYGSKAGILSGVVYGVIQCIIGASNSLAYLTHSILLFVICLLFDFLIAFSALGLAGAFKKSIKNPQVAFGLGALLSGLLRYICHFVSGWIVWGEYAKDTVETWGAMGDKILGAFNGQALAVIYSLVYNGSYMIPEILISVICAVVLISVKPIKKEAYKNI